MHSDTHRKPHIYQHAHPQGGAGAAVTYYFVSFQQNHSLLLSLCAMLISLWYCVCCYRAAAPSG